MIETKYQPNHRVWFKKSPRGIESTPNATYNRALGTLNGESVCEIIYKADKWIVKESELKTTPEALLALAYTWQTEIELKRKPEQTKKALAAALFISTSILRKRLKFITEHLPKTKTATLDSPSAAGKS